MKNLTATMMTSISEVMETMFYSPVEIQEQTQPLQKAMTRFTPFKTSLIRFTGDFSGQVMLAIPVELLKEMTENFMGESEEHLTDEYLSGTLTESLNMISGNGLKNLESSVPFELGIPEAVVEADIDPSWQFHIIKTPQSTMAVHILVDE